MTVLLIAGSPSNPSRSAALLDAVEQRLNFRGVDVERLQIRDLSPQQLWAPVDWHSRRNRDVSCVWDTKRAGCPS